MRKLWILLFCCFVFIFCISCNQEDNTNDEVLAEYEYTETDVKVNAGTNIVNGKLLIPISNEKVPAVIIMPGSGLNVDMDSTVGLIKPLKEIAEKLASYGIASIRYDKYSYEYPSMMMYKYSYTINEEYLNNAKFALDILKNNEKIDSNNIFIAGHSLGGQIAPIFINQNEEINGLIILAGTPVHILTGIIEYLEQSTQPDRNELINYAKYARSIKELKPEEMKHYYFQYYVPYWVEYNKYDFKEEAITSAINHKTLVMQGGLDGQVTLGHNEIYKEMYKDNENVTFNYYPLLNHLFVDGTNDKIEELGTTYREVPDDFVIDIAKWIIRNKK